MPGHSTLFSVESEEIYLALTGQQAAAGNGKKDVRRRSTALDINGVLASFLRSEFLNSVKRHRGLHMVHQLEAIPAKAERGKGGKKHKSCSVPNVKRFTYLALNGWLKQSCQHGELSGP